MGASAGNSGKSTHVVKQVNSAKSTGALAAQRYEKLRQICLEYPFEVLYDATRGFDQSRILGAGSAGSVFRAELPDGSFAAVKLIDLASHGDESAVAGFEDEVMVLSKFRHPNVVVLMGWAHHERRRFLVYEFLPGGDLEGRLRKSREGQMRLLWHERLCITLGAAMGLAHLHNAQPKAYHRDVKPANILLSPGGAKLADFGLSCVSKTRKGVSYSCQFTSGTPGYACPHYLMTGKMTEGREIFSFGMVLLEVLLNKMAAGMLEGEIVYPIQQAILPLQPGAVERAVSQVDHGALWPQPVAVEIASLGLACINMDESQRPSFNDVCRTLRRLQQAFPANWAPQPPSAVPMAPPLAVINSFQPAVQGLRPGPPIMQPGEAQVFGGLSAPALLVPQCRAPGLGQAGQCLPPFVLKAPSKIPQRVSVPVVVEVEQSFPSRGLAPQSAAFRELPSQSTLKHVNLEIFYAHTVTIDFIRPELRQLPLVSYRDISGVHTCKVGRSHQADWFATIVPDPAVLNSISREAFSISWNSTEGLESLALHVLGTGLVLVDDVIVRPDRGAVSLRPGCLITLAFRRDSGQLAAAVGFLVRCSFEERPPAISASCVGPTSRATESLNLNGGTLIESWDPPRFPGLHPPEVRQPETRPSQPMHLPHEFGDFRPSAEQGLCAPGVAFQAPANVVVAEGLTGRQAPLTLGQSRFIFDAATDSASSVRSEGVVAAPQVEGPAAYPASKECPVTSSPVETPSSPGSLDAAPRRDEPVDSSSRTSSPQQDSSMQPVSLGDVQLQDQQRTEVDILGGAVMCSPVGASTETPAALQVCKPEVAPAPRLQQNLQRSVASASRGARASRCTCVVT